MRILLLITWVLTTSLLPSASAAQANSQFSVTLHALDEPTKAGTELRLKVTITNVSDHDIRFARTPGPIPDETLTYRVEIHDDQGHVPEETAFFRELNQSHSYFGSYTTRILKPGESFEDAVVITRLYNLKPGKYTIWVARGQQALGGAPKDATRSNELTATVVP